MPTVVDQSVNPKSGTRVHEIYIKAEPGAIWDALTSPKWTAQYGYRALSEYVLKPGGTFQCKANAQMRAMGLPDVIIDGEVIESSPPRKLVQTYRFLFNDAHRAEGFTRLSWEIVPTEAGFCRLTVTHDTTNAPQMAAATISTYNKQGGGGWNWILSDLKSLMETGKAM